MSRLTFRERAGAVCYQKQLRDRFLDEGIPAVPHLDVKLAIVRPVSRALAEQIILKYEWLGTMGTGVMRCYGIFFGPWCAGVTTFANSGGTLASLLRTFNCSAPEVSYLVRGACTHWAPPNTNSKLIAHSCRLERQYGVKLVVAFADSDAGEIGTVYQACGWLYLGRGSSWEQWISPQGRIYTQNALTNRRRIYGCTTRALQQQLREAGWRVQYTNPKGRYVCVLDRTDAQLVARVEAMRQPYPKRDRSRENAAASSPGRGRCDSDPVAPSNGIEP